MPSVSLILVNLLMWNVLPSQEMHLYKQPTTKIPCTGEDCKSSITELAAPPEEKTTRSAPPEDLLTCHQCRRCNNATTSNWKVECKFSACCYIAFVADYANEQSFAVRGCAPVNKSCIEACKHIQLEHQLAHPSGAFDYCITCTGNGCNMNPYILSKLVTRRAFNGVVCYACHNCSQVVSTTPTVRCSQPKCCYTAIIKDNLDSQNIVVRGCHEHNCSDTCRIVIKENLLAHAGGKINFCLTCGDGEGDECNRNSYNPKLYDGQIDEINCFECEHCEDIKVDTVKVRCSSNCCYSILVMGNFQRGCVMDVEGHGCQHYCSNIATSLRIDYCEICNGNECNTMRINQTSLYKRQASVYCYSCTACEQITTHTPTAYCQKRCCYATMLRNDDRSVAIRRGCARISSHSQCSQFCELQKGHAAIHPVGLKNFYCAVCSTHTCNRQKLDPHFKPRGISGYYPKTCYSCTNCVEIIQDTELIQCPDGCCYMAIWTEGDRKSLVRHCALLGHRRCEDFCGYLMEQFTYPYDGALHYCRTCGHGRCNSEPAPEHFEPISPKDIQCYHCDDCAKVANNAPKVSCLSGCCYSQLKFGNNGNRTAERGCAKLFPATPCHKFCEHAEKLHKRVHPRGLVSFCKACSIDNCNSIQLNNAVIGETDIAIKCYACENCYTVGDDQLTNCSTGCCYTVSRTYFAKTHVTRNCIIPEHTPCADYCDVQEIAMLYTDPEAKLNRCHVCKTSECNNFKIEEPASVKSAMSCYQCEDCDSLNIYDPTAACNSRCCYTALLQDDYDSRITSERGCASLSEVDDCASFCNNLFVGNKERNTTTRNCTYCIEDRCNHMNMKPLRDIFSTPFKCCETDSSNICKEEDKTCNTYCCHSTYIWEENVTLRGCASDVDRFSESCEPNKIKEWLLEREAYSHYSMYSLITDTCQNSICNNRTNWTNDYITCNMCVCKDKCNTTTDPCNKEVCSNKCCYSAFIIENQETKRGCAKDDIFADSCRHEDVHKWYEQTLSNTEKSVLSEACQTDDCNIKTEWTKPIQCHRCTNCKNNCGVGNNENCNQSIECKSQCCYWALHGTEGTINRGCSTEDYGLNCKTELVKLKFESNVGTGGIFEVCSTDNCNAKSSCYKCYACEGLCGHTDSECKQPEPCPNKCCYSAYILEEQKTHRGCASNSFKGMCTDNNVEVWFKLHILNKHQEEAGWTVQTEACKTTNCNKKVGKDWNTPIKCYNCNDCKNDCADRTTGCKEKRSCDSQCCYLAVYGTEGKINRGCSADSFGIKCRDGLVLNNLKETIQLHDVVLFEVCSKENCNNKSLITCYTCKGCKGTCGHENGNCSKIEACENKCCFSVLVLEEQEIHRGCVDDIISGTCKDEDIKRWFIGDEKEKYKYMTVQTQACDTSNCNKKLAKEWNPAIECYNCTNCKHECNVESRKCKSVQPCESNCCFLAAHGTEGNITRGCMKDVFGANCYRELVQEKLEQTKQLDNVVFFEACSEKKCNNQSVITCYKCDGCKGACGHEDKICNKIVACETNCCFSIFIVETQVMNRGCVNETFSGQCTSENIKNWFIANRQENANRTVHTKACHTTTCNKKLAKEWNPAIDCYNCTDCESECNIGSPTCGNEKTCDSNCCYLVAHGKEGKITRGCSKHAFGVNCNNAFVKTDLKNTENMDNILFIEACDIESCNNKPLITCYKCKGCTVACGHEEDGCKEIVACEHNCCYSVNILEEQEMHRGCFDITNSKTCTEDDVRDWFIGENKQKYENLTVQTQACDTIKCNKQVSKDWNPAKICYNCTDCKNECAVRTTECEEIVECNSRCCYEAIHGTEGKIRRGCSDASFGLKCETELVKTNFGELDNLLLFDACKDEDKCNSKSLLTCYNCKGCKKACGHEEDGCNEIVYCEHNCCYSVNILEEQEMHRGCFDITNSKTCTEDDVRDWFIGENKQKYENLTVQTQACDTIKCNKQVSKDWNPAKICYNCTDCKNECAVPTTECKENVECNSRCCYEALHGTEMKIRRGCSEASFGLKCQTELVKQNIEGLHHILLFGTCNDKDFCNSNPLVTCFKCDDCTGECGHTNSKCKTLEPCYSQCCYSAFILETQVMTRGCCEDVTTCTNTNVETWFGKKKNILSNVTLYTEACDTPNCNRKSKKDFNGPPIYCYKCDCKNSFHSHLTCDINTDKCQETIPCESKCCYARSYQLDAQNVILRDCKKDAYGKLCKKDFVCDVAENKWSPNCAIACTSDFCNDISIHNRPI